MPTFTCAPYQTMFRPRFGAQIAWAEIQCHRLCQFGHRRQNKSLWRLHRPLLRADGQGGPITACTCRKIAAPRCLVEIESLPDEWPDAGAPRLHRRRLYHRRALRQPCPGNYGSARQ